MAYDYERLRTVTVNPLILEYGVAMTLSRIEDTASFIQAYDPTTMSFYWYDPDTMDRYDEQPEATDIEYEGTGVLTKFKVEEIDGELIKTTDKLILTSDLPEPQQGDKITVGSVVYQYINHEKVAPANYAVLYKIQVRI